VRIPSRTLPSVLTKVYSLYIQLIAKNDAWIGTDILPNVKKSKKLKKKDSQLVIRIGGKEREVFVSLCDELDTSAAREIRRFIRDFVHEHKT